MQHFWLWIQQISFSDIAGLFFCTCKKCFLAIELQELGRFNLPSLHSTSIGILTVLLNWKIFPYFGNFWASRGSLGRKVLLGNLLRNSNIFGEIFGELFHYFPSLIGQSQNRFSGMLTVLSVLTLILGKHFSQNALFFRFL